MQPEFIPHTLAQPVTAAPVRAIPASDGELDLASLAASVTRKLGPTADPARVDAVLAGLAAELLPGARVRKYLSVILHRQACERLRAESASPRS